MIACNVSLLDSHSVSTRCNRVQRSTLRFKPQSYYWSHIRSVFNHIHEFTVCSYFHYGTSQNNLQGGHNCDVAHSQRGSVGNFGIYCNTKDKPIQFRSNEHLKQTLEELVSIPLWVLTLTVKRKRYQLHCKTHQHGH